MPGTALIINEDVNAQIIAETLLRLRGLGVRLATDAAEASAIVAHEVVDVVVVDLGAPGMSDGAVLRQLRDGFGATPPPRLVLVTDRTEPAVDRFARRLGVDAVLRKPLEPGQFIATVERLLPAASRHPAGAGRQPQPRSSSPGGLAGLKRI